MMFGIDWFLGLVPQWVPWVIVGIGITLFVLVQFTQRFIPIIYRIPIVIGVELLSLVLFAGGFYVDGRQAVLINAKTEIEQTVSDQKDISAAAVAKLQKDLDDEKAKHDKLIKSIPKYITKADDSKCVVPQSFVRLHNYAAEDSVPESTTRANGIAAGIEYITGK